MATISQRGIDLIKRFESCHLGAYQDSNGIWTIGWGHTGTVNGVPVNGRMVITQELADNLLREDLATASQAVERHLTRAVSQDQFDALVSLTYNAGEGTLVQSDVLKYVNQGRLSAAAESFVHIIRGSDGSILEGLVRRRAAEIVRFMGG